MIYCSFEQTNGVEKFHFRKVEGGAWLVYTVNESFCLYYLQRFAEFCDWNFLEIILQVSITIINTRVRHNRLTTLLQRCLDTLDRIHLHRIIHSSKSYVIIIKTKYLENIKLATNRGEFRKILHCHEESTSQNLEFSRPAIVNYFEMRVFFEHLKMRSQRALYYFPRPILRRRILHSPSRCIFFTRNNIQSLYNNLTRLRVLGTKALSWIIQSMAFRVEWDYYFRIELLYWFHHAVKSCIKLFLMDYYMRNMMTNAWRVKEHGEKIIYKNYYDFRVPWYHIVRLRDFCKYIVILYVKLGEKCKNLRKNVKVSAIFARIWMKNYCFCYNPSERRHGTREPWDNNFLYSLLSVRLCSPTVLLKMVIITYNKR